MKLSKADQARASAALLRLADMGAGWKGGAIKATPLTPPGCPGFDPKESDLVVTGHADARFTYPAGGVELDQDVQVLASAAAVKTDFKRTISPRLGRCLAYQLQQLPNVSGATVQRISFPATGSVSAVYRALIVVHSGNTQATLVSDYVFFGEGRTEYEFTVVAPVSAREQLMQFEVALATVLLKRAGVPSA